MHEIGIARNMFNLVLEEARKVDAKKVYRIDLVIGEMTGAVGDSVRFYLDLLGKGTIAEGADVAIRTVPPMVRCRNCRMPSELERKMRWQCPHCAGNHMEIIAGRELIVKSIGVQTNGDKDS